MALTDQNIRLMASEVLADVPEGGGRMSGVEVIDGVSNNLMPDVSDLDRTMGNVALRKAFPAVLADNTDTYYGVTVIVDKAPVDPNVSVTLFTTKSWTDHRSDAVSRMESYLARGPKYDGFLWDQHIAGQKALAIIQRTDRELPPIGSTMVLVKDAGKTTEKTQFERILKTAASNRVFSASGCSVEFTRTVINADVSDPLLVDMLGGIPNCNDDAATTKANTTLYTTVVADAAQYAGITPLAEPASMGSYSLKVNSIFGQLVPSAQVESAITDARPHNSTLLPISAGATVTFSGAYTFGATSNLFVGQSITPGTLAMTLNGTALTDKAGKLMSGNTQVGLVDYQNGILSRFDPNGYFSLSVSFQPAAFPVRNMQTASWAVTPESRSQTIVFILDPIPQPGSLSISFMAQGKWYTLRDDFTGALRGDDSSYGSGVLNFSTGSVSITLGALPDVGTAVMAVWGTKGIDTVRTAIPVKAGMDLTLSNKGIAPSTMTITWPDGAGGTKTATDNGLGDLTGDATGSLSYARGTVHIEPNILPPGGAVFTIAYSWGDPIEEVFSHPVRNANGKLELSLAHPLVLEKSVEVEWNLLVDVSQAGSDNYYTTTRWIPAPIPPAPAPLPGQSPQPQVWNVWVDPIEIDRDNGTGAFLEDATASLDYSAGKIIWQPDRIIKIPIPNYVNEALGTTEVVSAGRTTVTSSWHYHLAGFRYADAPAVYPNDETGLVKIRYRTAAAGNAASETFTFTPVFDVTPGYSEQVVPGSVNITHAGKRLIDRQAKLYTDIDYTTGAGTEVGNFDYSLGKATLSAWPNAAPNAGQVDGIITTLGTTPVDSVTFRTASAPLRPGSLVLQFVFAGTNETVTVTAGTDGTITGNKITGKIDYQTGIVQCRFGEWISATAPETYFPAGQTVTRAPWYTNDAVVGGQIFFPAMVLADTLRYAAVAYTYIPLDKDILGVDPVRLPTDGRVPIFRIGNIGVAHHTQSTPVASLTVPQTVNLGRTRLSRVWLFDEGNADVRVPTTKYTADLDAGTVTLTDATGLVGPIRIEDRIEDMALISEVQINGQLTFTRPLTHDYPIGTQVSSALVIGNLQARVGAIFDQATWTGEWSDELIGSESLAEYNSIQYPILVTNEGAAQERWALIFNSPTEVRVIGESVGQIATLSIANEIAPLNPATNKPYFRINPLGWGSGWSAGNLLRINTIAANYPVWIARTVKQGPGITGGDGFRVQIRGNANAQ